MVSSGGQGSIFRSSSHSAVASRNASLISCQYRHAGGNGTRPKKPCAPASHDVGSRATQQRGFFSRASLPELDALRLQARGDPWGAGVLGGSAGRSPVGSATQSVDRGIGEKMHLWALALGENSIVASSREEKFSLCWR
jgi:hypothetical protein